MSNNIKKLIIINYLKRYTCKVLWYLEDNVECTDYLIINIVIKSSRFCTFLYIILDNPILFFFTKVIILQSLSWYVESVCVIG